MEQHNLDGVAVYGDEYRKENLRYVSNFWPIFERGMCFIPQNGDPILTGAPEGEVYAREMSIWQDIRNVKETIHLHYFPALKKYCTKYSGEESDSDFLATGIYQPP